MVERVKKSTVFLVVLSSALVFLVSSFMLTRNNAPRRIELPKEAVSKKILDNGLVVLVKNSPPKDLAAIHVRIKAGASLEAEYLGSGISHFVEHMVFKGTRTRPAGAIEREAKSYGGFLNGSVSPDMTDFYITVPKEYLSPALALLKDMLLNATFDTTEMEKERGVLLNEMRMNKDEPQTQLVRLLNENAYLRHPYRYPTIGYEGAFSRLTREDLVKYYTRMYVPNRMVVAIVGDVEAADTITKVENEFMDFRPSDYGVIDPGPQEPAQIDARSVEEEKPINLVYIAMGFHSTGLLSEDLFAMDVLAMILGRGDNSRLNTSVLKSKRLVHSIACWNYTPRDPGLFVITAIADKDNIAAAEDAIISEVNKIKRGDVGDRELESAKRMVLGDYIYSLQTIDGQASDISLNYLATGSYDFSRRYVEGIQAVSKFDVRRAADTYLKWDGLTNVKLLPQGAAKSGIAASEEPACDVLKMAVLPNGLKIVTREDAKTPTVSITVAVLGGLMIENGSNNGISNLLAEMMLKGTAARSEDKIVGAVEARGGRMGSFSGMNSFGLTMEILKDDLDASLDLLKDILTNSAFPQAQIDKEKILILAGIKEEDDDIFQRGFNAIRKEVFEGSTYAMRYLGNKDTVESIKRYDLLKFYKDYCVASNMVITISGDIRTESVMKSMRERFDTLRSAGSVIAARQPLDMEKMRSENIAMPKDQSLVLMGFKTVGVKSRDRYALDLLTSVLSGYSGRLFSELRDKRSFAYTLGCVQRSALDTGLMVFYVATTKEKVPEVKKALFEQIDAVRQSLVSDDELTLAARELCTNRRLAKQANSFFSATLALDELYGLGYGNLYKYEDEIGEVTKEDLKTVAEKYLNLDAYAEVVISPE